MIMSKYIGTKDFYKRTLGIAVPIMIQNGITNFVGMLDNIMVGQVGTEQMSGIAIVNQLLFIFSLAIFGAVAGAGIFTAQYYGKGDNEGVRNTFRFKLCISIIITVIGVLIFVLYGQQLIQMFLKGDAKGLSVEEALLHGKKYMYIMLIGLLPLAIEQTYSSTLRECGETVVSMKAGIAAISVNLILNYILIFGKLGCPKLGVVGAAIATVISRYVQAAIVIAWTHRHTEKMPFIVGAYRSFAIPGALTRTIIKKGTPLFINEVLWSAGMAMLNQCYSLRGLDAIAAINISTTVTNLFNVAFVAMGDAIAIVVGQQLGANDFENARDTDRKLIVFTGFICVVLGILILGVSPFFPMLYKTTEGVRSLATAHLMVSAFYIPIWGLMHAMYFTLRSGGNTIITFLFDSAFLWGIIVPAAFLISRKTAMPFITMYFVIESANIIKCIIGAILVKKGVWLNNIVV